MQCGFDLLRGVAHELSNEGELSGKGVRRRFKSALERIKTAARQATPGSKLQKGLDHFVKVSASYEPGLFHCYDLEGLSRTNNDLEQVFGSTRHHERRCTGRKVASPSLVLRGSVRLVAGLGTRGRCYSGEELAPEDLEAWKEVRSDLEKRRESRVLRCRFRRDPAKYLGELEDKLLKAILPI